MMLKEFVEKIQSMANEASAKVIEVDGEQYSTQRIYKVDPTEYRPNGITVNSLESIITLVRNEAVRYTDNTIFVQVEDPLNVNVFTTFDDKNRRDFLYMAKADIVSTPIDQWTGKESLMIALNSVFIPSEDVDYIQSVLQKVTEESKVSSTDNGLGQSIEAQKGIALKENMTLKKRVKLRPYRTFLEVEQPESEFILRADEGAKFLIKSADGGAWELAAKSNIKVYLVRHLTGLKNVIVMA